MVTERYRGIYKNHKRKYSAAFYYSLHPSLVKKIITIPIFFFSYIILYSQDYNIRSITIIEDLIEEIARDSEEDLDYTTLFNDLTYYLDHPLNLNTASYDELEKLHFLTDFQIRSLHQYISENGELLSIYELPLVYGFSEELARNIETFVIVVPGKTVQRDFEPGSFLHQADHQLFVRTSGMLQEQLGYTSIDDSLLQQNPNARYQGSPLKFYTRYAFRYKDRIRAGYTGEKDAGEEFFAGTNPHGFDFNSAYLQVSNNGWLKEFIAGDYEVSLGQGVNTWSGLAFNKSPEVINLRRKSQGLSGFTSTNENVFFRGCAATAGHSRFSLTGFISNKHIDANITEMDSISDEPIYFSSFQTSGIHALPRQVEDEDAVRETVIGGNLSCRLDHARLGLTVTHYFFDAELLKGDDPYEFFSFYGSKNTNYSIDYFIQTSKLSLFGEAGMSSNRGLAMMNGALVEIEPSISLAFIQRIYQRDYQALYANAFSENTRTTNENGFYMGIVMHPFMKWSFSGYIDAFLFPWLRYHTDSPASGHDWFLQADYHTKEGLNAYTRLHSEHIPMNIQTVDPGIDPAGYKILSRFRFHFDYPVGPGIIFEDRLELSFSKKNGEELLTGYLVYHDILFKPGRFPVSFALRYAMFDTEGWDPRIYAYEHDVLYGFAIPAFYDRGIRAYLNARYTINKYLDLWLKISNTYWPDRETIGSGLDRIDGKNRTDFKVQVRIRI
ncbi:MAG: hypothetical protein AMS27_10600 [Bacteroides sp. SM23_62_1]|nr:MAG: hypothetical protein AMS27_10600 [Bacteroides sp. SM23_62_1]